MIPTLVAFLMLQAGAQSIGAVTGVVRSSSGPASGVRVYAQQVRDTADATSPAAPLEGLAQTDATGRYRLELPVGRYYIASGSVSAPTYYPGTTDLAKARVITVAAGGIVEGIDFGSFVPAPTNPLGIAILLPSGFLSGTVRYPDGTPARNIRVIAFSSTAFVPAAVVPYYTYAVAQTDASGRYRVQTSASDTFYIAAGFAEDPVFYTGGGGATAPKTVTLTPPSTVDALDMEIPFPTSRTGTTVKGQVVNKDGSPAWGVSVVIAKPIPSAMGVMAIRLPSAYPVPDTPVAPDGTFEFSNVVPGFYNGRASRGTNHVYISFEVGEGPVTDLKFTMPE
jgi:hypothetical protein